MWAIFFFGSAAFLMTSCSIWHSSYDWSFGRNTAVRTLQTEQFYQVSKVNNTAEHESMLSQRPHLKTYCQQPVRQLQIEGNLSPLNMKKQWPNLPSRWFQTGLTLTMNFWLLTWPRTHVRTRFERLLNWEYNLLIQPPVQAWSSNTAKLKQWLWRWHGNYITNPRTQENWAVH